MLWAFKFYRHELDLPTRVYPTEPKLVIFLQNCVINRKRKIQKNKEAAEEIVGRDTVNGYVFAVEWFWSYLIGMDHINEMTNPKPNGILVKSLLDTVERGKLCDNCNLIFIQFHYVTNLFTCIYRNTLEKYPE